ncbi:hypothetical protein [Polaribacter sp. SA4-12]|uniref:hypothetical protein n=1 Tax=Polaribacter sp. SA4-12 TaxID=1312072 RepID=UPI000B3D1EEC|nr:hypothetical protein [Polaribacter sp. SA4-12]ARV14547.1 hypothetical protein BTO07_05010 [Polaribacter sp. SA4-12]
MENKIKNSEEYLSSILGKKSGFSIPKNYFSTTEDAIEAKLAEETFTKEKGFTIPDSYFKELENDILAKVTSTKKETKVISFKERVLKFIPIAAAASVILFIGLNSFVFNKTEELTLDSLSDVDIEYWLDSNTLNTNDVTLILQDDVLDDDDFYFATLEDENIEDYINSIDNSSILEELN